MLDVEAGVRCGRDAVQETGFGAWEVGPGGRDDGEGGGAEEVLGEGEADATGGGRDEGPGHGVGGGMGG